MQAFHDFFNPYRHARTFSFYKLNYIMIIVKIALRSEVYLLNAPKQVVQYLYLVLFSREPSLDDQLCMVVKIFILFFLTWCHFEGIIEVNNFVYPFERGRMVNVSTFDLDCVPETDVRMKNSQSLKLNNSSDHTEQPVKDLSLSMNQKHFAIAFNIFFRRNKIRHPFLHLKFERCELWFSSFVSISIFKVMSCCIFKTIFVVWEVANEFSKVMKQKIFKLSRAVKIC